MKKGIRLSGIIVWSVVLILFVQCRSDHSKSSSGKDSFQIDSANQAKDFKKYFRAPSPEEVFMFFANTNLRLNLNILSKPEYQTNFLNTKTQSVNLGIYSSDMAYLNLFEQSTQVLQYFEAIYLLSDKLKITAIFQDSTIAKAVDNVDNLDSLIYLSNKIYMNIVDFLTDNNRENILSMVSIGAFVEIMHLSISSVNDYNNESDLVQHIADQKALIDNVFDYAEQFSDDVDVASTLNDMKGIKSIFDQLKKKGNTSETSTDSSQEMLIEGGPQYQMTQDEFDRLKHEVEKVRAKFISKSN